MDGVDGVASLKPVIYFIDSARLNRPWNIDMGDALSGTDQAILSVASGCTARGLPVVLMCTRLPADAGSSALRVVAAESFLSAIKLAREMGAAHFVFPATGENEQLAVLRDCKVGVPLVGWAHNSPSFDWMRAAGVSPNLTTIVAVSDGQAAYMAMYRAFRKVVSIPNPVHSTVPAPAAAQHVRSAQQVTFVGALTPSKGFHWLAQAWPGVYAKHPSWRLVVCGSSGLYGNKGLHPGSNGLADREYEECFLGFLGGSLQSASAMGVTFRGSVSKKSLQAQISDSAFVVVNPNWRDSTETFCMSAVESLVLGRAVIGGRAGALPETVGHGRGGLLNSSVLELQENICRLIENQELRVQLAEAGRSWSLRHYSQDAVINRWCDFLGGKRITRFYSSEQSAFPPFYRLRRLAGWLIPSAYIGVLKRLKAKARPYFGRVSGVHA